GRRSAAEAAGRGTPARGAHPRVNRARTRARRDRSPDSRRVPCGLSCPAMKLGVLPRLHQSVITDATWVREFGALCEDVGVESVWTVEHLLVAEDYEPRYSYSEDGRMPGTPGTVMPDPLEWLSYLAACTTTVK